jgi:hypothetical protein
MIARNIDRLSSPEGAPSCGLSRHKESELLFTIWLRPTAALGKLSRIFHSILQYDACTGFRYCELCNLHEPWIPGTDGDFISDQENGAWKLSEAIPGRRPIGSERLSSTATGRNSKVPFDQKRLTQQG